MTLEQLRSEISGSELSPLNRVRLRSSIAYADPDKKYSDDFDTALIEAQKNSKANIQSQSKDLPF